MKILFMLSNPKRAFERDPTTGEIIGIQASESILQLDEEYRSIEQAIAKNSNKDTIQLVPKMATRMEDLIDALNQEKPDILHFSGHGYEKTGELCLIENDYKTGVAIPTEALSDLFTTTADNLKLVFLDSCYSKVQGEAIIEHVDYVIGMNDSVGDHTASTLATRFYASFATGISLQNAFKQAKTMLISNHPEEKTIPELLMRHEEVADFSLSDSVADEETKNSSGTTINIGGDLKGVAQVGDNATITQNIS